MKKRRGFLGPIGDDIPAIFPIVAGLLLFFGVMAIGANAREQKDAYLELRKAALSMTYAGLRSGKIDTEEIIYAKQKTANIAQSGNLHYLIEVRSVLPVKINGKESKMTMILCAFEPGKGSESIPSNRFFKVTEEEETNCGKLGEAAGLGDAVFLPPSDYVSNVYSTTLPYEFTESGQKLEDVKTIYGPALYQIYAWRAGAR